MLAGVTQTLNNAVSAKLKASKPGQGPAADEFSLFATMHAITAYPTLFGFSDITHPYLVVLAGDPDTFLFWDDVHPTTAGHGVLADFAFEKLERLYPELRRHEHHAGCGDAKRN
jgi:phospholipase/lecithinase/hemolysin